MKVVIAGASGFLGSALVSFLEARGHEVYRLVRKSGGKPCEILWDPEKKEIPAGQLEGFDAIVNLSGENIAEGRWTEERKQRILLSRVGATKLLAETIAKLAKKPQVLINASAIGIYGSCGEEWVDETAMHGTDFLANVCQAWEESVKAAEEAGVRTVRLRIGVVLSKSGGALKQMLLPFRLGLGGVIGSGQQYMSWILLEDLLAIIESAMTQVQYVGAINAVAPQPVTNREFTKELGAAMHRPTILPMPKFVVRLVFGEMGDALLLSSTRVKSAKLQELGYKFLCPDLKSALKRLFE